MTGRQRANRARDLSWRLSRRWWLVLAAGLLAGLAGVAVLAGSPSLVGLAVAAGAAMVARSTTYAVLPCSGPGPRSTRAVAATLGTLAGFGCIAWPHQDPSLLATVLGWWLVGSGVLVSMASADGWRWSAHSRLPLALGVVEVVLGSALLAPPEVPVAMLAAAVGAWLVTSGVLTVALALHLRRPSPDHEHDLSVALDRVSGRLDELHARGLLHGAQYRPLRAAVTGEQTSGDPGGVDHD